MKRVSILIAAVVVLAVLSVSCNNYVCPAYSDGSAEQEQNDDSNS